MNKFIEKIKRLPLPVKQWGLFAAWMGAFMLAGILLWGLTGNIRSQVMMSSVNSLLARSDSPYRLDRQIGALGRPGRAMQMGSWFTLKNSSNRAVVFPLIAGTNIAAVLVLLSPEGKVESLVPLSINAAQLFERLPAGAIQLYIRRAEEAHALLGALPGGGGL
jgi:hypothetical protein